MIRGFYTAVTSMATRQIQQENLSNNIANINTPGFKKSDVSIKTFEDMLIQRRESFANSRNRSEAIGYLNSGVGIDEIKKDYTQGAIRRTDKKTDFAINGDKFMFNVVDANGKKHLSRDGKFHVADGGYLVDSQGRRVIGSDNKPIIINGNEPDLNKSGILTNSNGNVGFMLTEINTENGQAVRQGGNLEAVSQGVLEGSNVNVEDVMTEIITVSRNYESAQKVLLQMDESLGKAVNEVGVVR
ncbi:MAG: flagellar hook-basal body complex protein [Clostridium sp.]